LPFVIGKRLKGRKGLMGRKRGNNIVWLCRIPQAALLSKVRDCVRRYRLFYPVLL